MWSEPAQPSTSNLSVDDRVQEGLGEAVYRPREEMSLERKDSQGLHAKPAALPGLLPGKPHRGQGWHRAIP